MFFNLCWWRWRWTNHILLYWDFKQKRCLAWLKTGAHFSRMQKNLISREVKYPRTFRGTVVALISAYISLKSHYALLHPYESLMHSHTSTDCCRCVGAWSPLKQAETCFYHVSVHFTRALAQRSWQGFCTELVYGFLLEYLSFQLCTTGPMQLFGASSEFLLCFVM